MRIRNYIYLISLITTGLLISLVTGGIWSALQLSHQYNADTFEEQIKKLSSTELTRQSNLLFEIINFTLEERGWNVEDIKELLTVEDQVSLKIALFDTQGRFLSGQSSWAELFFDVPAVVIKNTILDMIEQERWTFSFPQDFPQEYQHLSVYQNYKVFPEKNLVVGVGTNFQLSLLRFNFQQNQNLEYNMKLLTGFSIGVILLSLMVMFLLYRTMQRVFLKPLQELALGLRRLGHQDFSTPLELSSSREIAAISAGFNNASAALQSSYREIAKRETQYRTLIENIPEKVFLKDKDSRYISCNKAFSEDFNLTPDEMAGKDDYDLFPADLARKFIEDDQRVMALGKTVHFEEQYYKEGKPLWVRTTKTPVYDEDHNVIGVLAIFFDITQRMQEQQNIKDMNTLLEEKVNLRTRELEEAKVRAERASKAKSLFLANMSHEIRTPLTVMLGYARLMGDNLPRDEKSQQYLETIQSSGEHLHELINDVLEFSKIEAGQMTLEENTFNLPLLLNRMADLFTLRAEEKQLQFFTEFSRDLPLNIQGDQKKLRQILINLLGNAFKFTTQGSVIFTVEEKGAEPSPWLQFTIKDSGPGISQEDQEEIFKPFVQSQKINSATLGTGLGLAITKEFITCMGGDLQLISALGEGSEFQITIPYKLPPLEETKPAPVKDNPVSFEGRRILIVDDSAPIRNLLSDLLTREGITVATAPDGQIGSTMALEDRYDLILMDQRMPHLSGMEAIAKIRREETFHNRIIMLSASVFDEEIKGFLKAGADGFVSKPIKFPDLLKAIGQQLSSD